MLVVEEGGNGVRVELDCERVPREPPGESVGGAPDGIGGASVPCISKKAAIFFSLGERHAAGTGDEREEVLAVDALAVTAVRGRDEEEEAAELLDDFLRPS